MAGGYGAGGGSFALDVRGEEQLQLRIQAIRAGLEGNQLRRANLVAANIMATAARATTPSRTGRLRATVRPRATRNTARVAAGGPGVPYAGVIHWGTVATSGRPSNIRAQPWLSNAAEATEPAWTHAYWQYVQNLCDRNS